MITFRTMRAEWSGFWNRLTGVEDARQIRELLWRVKQLEEEATKRDKRGAEQHVQNEDLRRRLNEISAQNIRLEQQYHELHGKFSAALVTVKLYEAAGTVMQDALSQSYRIDRS